jgi:predicted ABC-type ATPase
MKYINVRGCNGSGKTTLLRSLATDPLCRVTNAIVPDHKPIPVTYCPDGLAIIGDYTPAAAGSTTAGLDRIKTQAAAKAVAELVGRDPEVKAVLFEGVVVSTIYGPWQEWSKANGGMIWAFLDTPLEVCLKRIQERNGGKPIKEDQVADKHRTIARVREKALAAGEAVVVLRWETPREDLMTLINELGGAA